MLAPLSMEIKPHHAVALFQTYHPANGTSMLPALSTNGTLLHIVPWVRSAIRYCASAVNLLEGLFQWVLPIYKKKPPHHDSLSHSPLPLSANQRHSRPVKPLLGVLVAHRTPDTIRGIFLLFLKDSLRTLLPRARGCSTIRRP